MAECLRRYRSRAGARLRGNIPIPMRSLQICARRSLPLHPTFRRFALPLLSKDPYKCARCTLVGASVNCRGAMDILWGIHCRPRWPPSPERTTESRFRFGRHLRVEIGVTQRGCRHCLICVHPLRVTVIRGRLAAGGSRAFHTEVEPP